MNLKNLISSFDIISDKIGYLTTGQNIYEVISSNIEGIKRINFLL